MAFGCDPLTGMYVLDAAVRVEDHRSSTAETLVEVWGKPPTEEEVSEYMAIARAAHRTEVSADTFSMEEFEGATVIVAEEVALFWSTLPGGTSALEVVDRLVPPFERTFIEFQNCPNIIGVRSWGVLLAAEELDPDTGQWPDQRWNFVRNWWPSGTRVGRSAP